MKSSPEYFQQLYKPEAPAQFSMLDTAKTIVKPRVDVPKTPPRVAPSQIADIKKVDVVKAPSIYAATGVYETTAPLQTFKTVGDVKQVSLLKVSDRLEAKPKVLQDFKKKPSLRKETRSVMDLRVDRDVENIYN